MNWFALALVAFMVLSIVMCVLDLYSYRTKRSLVWLGAFFACIGAIVHLGSK